jgi:hypothetical protein
LPHSSDGWGPGGIRAYVRFRIEYCCASQLKASATAQAATTSELTIFNIEIYPLDLLVRWEKEKKDSKK